MSVQPPWVVLVAEIQCLPYVWPGPPDAASARAAGQGTCASKHALLAEALERLGIVSSPLLSVGRLVPACLASDPKFAPAAGLLEVHECLVAEVPGVGERALDVTWDPALLRRGLPGTYPWDGVCAMALAVAPERQPIPVLRKVLRECKERLRSDLYGPGERNLRDLTLAALSARFGRWRSEALPEGRSALQMPPHPLGPISFH